MGTKDMNAYFQECLQIHNYFRNIHGVPPLKLDMKLTQTAQSHADFMARTNWFKHSEEALVYQRVGENIGKQSRPNEDYEIPEPLLFLYPWYNEIRLYNFDNQYDENAGHFTQVVWKASTKVGFGLASNENYHYFVANYLEPGNNRSRFAENVFPLKNKSAPLSFQEIGKVFGPKYANYVLTTEPEGTVVIYKNPELKHSTFGKNSEDSNDHHSFQRFNTHLEFPDSGRSGNDQRRQRIGSRSPSRSPMRSPVSNNDTIDNELSVTNHHRRQRNVSKSPSRSPMRSPFELSNNGIKDNELSVTSDHRRQRIGSRSPSRSPMRSPVDNKLPVTIPHHSQNKTVTKKSFLPDGSICIETTNVTVIPSEEVTECLQKINVETDEPGQKYPARRTISSCSISPDPIDEEELETFVTDVLMRLNHYRKLHGVRDLMLSEDLRIAAQKWAEEVLLMGYWKCDEDFKYNGTCPGMTSTHHFKDDDDDDKVGRDINATVMVDKCYELGSKSYKIGSEINENENTQQFGNFTQMLWKSSKVVGIGKARTRDRKRVVVVCYYYPPGNTYEAFRDNVLPRVH